MKSEGTKVSTAEPISAAGACLAAALFLCAPASSACAPQDSAPFALEDAPLRGPAPLDFFHPDNQPRADGTRPAQPRPALGGTVTVHLEGRPRSLNYAIENSAVTRRILDEVHAALIQQDWDTWELEPCVASDWVQEDVLVLTDEASARYAGAALALERRRSRFAEERERVHVLYGAVAAAGEGAEAGFSVEPRSAENPLKAARGIPARDVREHLRGAAITFHLRPGVLWHPSAGFERHALDARDVVFSWSVYENPGVDCGEKRWMFQKVARCDALGPLAVRFLLGETYYQSLQVVGEMCLLPAHLYDLSDPDNPAHRAGASAEAQARWINASPHNARWVGLGPYRVVESSAQVVEAERFEGWFDRSDAGFVDRIRWRHIPDDNAAFQALLAGELDYFDRVKSEDFFGPATDSEAFTSRFYKGAVFLAAYGFTAWNLRRPQFREVEVRKALAHAFDLEEFRRTYYRGYAQTVTGPMPYFSPGYDASVQPTPFDLEAASALLARAGWYDRDGDGLVDKDGVPLAFDLAMASGHDVSLKMGLRFQENLRRIGVECRIRTYEWAAFRERTAARDFDACSMAWIPDLENDPEQVWHSRWAGPLERSGNLSGLADPEVDRLIEAGQRELDLEQRMAIWRALHRRIDELHPILFLYNPPRKFALNRALRGHRTSRLDPGYVIRRWYYPEGTSGTRPLPE